MSSQEKDRKDLYQTIFLSLLFLILFFVAIAFPFKYSIGHDKPYGYHASDAFIHYIWAEALQDQGGWINYPPYFALNYKDTVAYNPPLLYQVSVIFSQAAMIPLWDAILFLTLLSVIAAIFAMFFLIKKHFNEPVAYLSMPLMAFMFFGPHYTIFSWGTWIYALASVFIVALFYFIDEPFYVIILLMAMIITHTSEFIFAAGFIGLYILYKRFKNLKEQAINISLAVIFSSYFLWLFYNTWMQVTPYKFAVDFAKNYTGIIVMTFWDFGWIFGILIILGMFVILINKQVNTLTLAGFYMLLVGYSSLAGFGLRAFQTRFFWPIYFAVFLGYLLYLVYEPMEKKIHPFLLMIVSLVCIAVILAWHPPLIGQGLLTQDRWDSLQWVKNNTSENETNLYFYADDINQAAMLWTSKKTPYYIGSQDLADWLDKGRPRNYTVRILGDSKSHYAYWDGWKIKHHWDEKENIENPIMDLCGFDYYHFSYLNMDKSLSDLHNELISKLLVHGNQIVFQEGGITMIKNLDKGGECYE